jgi:hypothetical protein
MAVAVQTNPIKNAHDSWISIIPKKLSFHETTGFFIWKKKLKPAICQVSLAFLKRDKYSCVFLRSYLLIAM